MPGYERSASAFAILSPQQIHFSCAASTISPPRLGAVQCEHRLLLDDHTPTIENTSLSLSLSLSLCVCVCVWMRPPPPRPRPRQATAPHSPSKLQLLRSALLPWDCFCSNVHKLLFGIWYGPFRFQGVKMETGACFRSRQWGTSSSELSLKASLLLKACSLYVCVLKTLRAVGRGGVEVDGEDEGRRPLLLSSSTSESTWW